MTYSQKFQMVYVLHCYNIIERKIMNLAWGRDNDNVCTMWMQLNVICPNHGYGETRFPSKWHILMARFVFIDTGKNSILRTEVAFGNTEWSYLCYLTFICRVHLVFICARIANEMRIWWWTWVTHLLISYCYNLFVRLLCNIMIFIPFIYSWWW